TGNLAAPVSKSVGNFPEAVAVGDFNGDGKLDLATANQQGGDVTVLLGDGTGKFTEAPHSPFSVGTNPDSVAVGDFNGDGKLDLVVANNGSRNVSVLLGDGTGNFSNAPMSPFRVGTNPAALAVADFNGDHKSDVAVANTGDNTIDVLLGDSN